MAGSQPKEEDGLARANVPRAKDVLEQYQEEARAPRSPGARFSPAPGDSRRDGQPRSGPARKPLRTLDFPHPAEMNLNPAASPEIGEEPKKKGPGG